MSTYFGGNDLGTVAKLQETTFRHLVDNVFNQPVMLNISRERFTELARRETDASLTREERMAAKRERSDAKKTAYLVSCTFPTSPSPRKVSGDVVLGACDLVFLDVDDPRQAFTLTVDDFNPLDSLPYSFVCYHTASSRPDAPKVRVVVSADAIPVESLGAAAAHLAGLLGLPDVTRESYVPNQPMYRPVVFTDDDLLEAHPVIRSKHSLPALRVDDIDLTAAPSLVTRTRTSSEDIGSIVGSVAGLTLENAAEALGHLDADDYHVWMETAFALKHQFGDEGYPLFLDWSSKSSKFGGEADCALKWKSARQHPDRAPVTFRTTLKRAKEAGYSAEEVSKNQLREALKWVNATPSAELLRDGPKKLLEYDLLTTLEKDSVEKAMVGKLREDGHKVGLPAMRKAVAQARTEKAKAEAEAVKKEKVKQEDMPAWARGIVYVAEQNEFVHRTSGNHFAPEALNNYYSVRLMDGAEGGKPTVLPQHYLLNALDLPRVNSLDYDPSNPTKAIVEEGGRRLLNTYRATYPESKDELSAEAGELLLGHLRKLLYDEREVGLLLSWMAFHVQEPGRKVRWAPVVQGAKGSGKSLLEGVMRAVLGQGNVMVVEGKTVVLGGKFNSWSWGSQLCVIEEVFVTGENRHQIMDTIKPCITNDRVTVERKGCDPEVKTNRQNYLLLTNHHDALPVDEHERRYFILHSRIQLGSQVRELRDSGHFDRFIPFLKEHPGAFRAFLEAWPYHPEFDPDGHAPDTKHLHAMARAAASGVQHEVRRWIAQQPPGGSFTTGEMLAFVRLSEARATRNACCSCLRELGWRDTGELWMPFDEEPDPMDVAIAEALSSLT